MKDLTLSPSDLLHTSEAINAKLKALPLTALLSYTDETGVIFTNISSPDNKILIAAFSLKYPKQYKKYLKGN